MIPIAEWKWSGQAGHQCVSNYCRYHLTTVVGIYIISTVGDWHPKGAGKMEKLTLYGYYDTAVFEVDEELLECGCVQIKGEQLDGKQYGNVKCPELEKGHFDMCMKYAKLQAV